VGESNAEFANRQRVKRGQRPLCARCRGEMNRTGEFCLVCLREDASLFVDFIDYVKPRDDDSVRIDSALMKSMLESFRRRGSVMIRHIEDAAKDVPGVVDAEVVHGGVSVQVREPVTHLPPITIHLDEAMPKSAVCMVDAEDE